MPCLVLYVWSSVCMFVPDKMLVQVCDIECSWNFVFFPRNRNELPA